MAMLGGLFGINGDGKVSCMDKVVSYGCGGRSWRRRPVSAGMPCFTQNARFCDPAGREAEEDIFVQVERAVNLLISGLDEEKLRKMDLSRRHEALIDAGLNPEVYAYLDN